MSLPLAFRQEVETLFGIWPHSFFVFGDRTSMTSGATLLEAVYQPLRDILEQKACGGAIGAMSSSSGSSTNGSAYHQHLLPAVAGGALISPPNSSDLSDTQQMPSYLLSNMEASGNANNQRANFTSSLDSRDVSSAAGSASTAAAASLVMQRAASTSALYPRPGPVAGAALSAQYARSNSLSNAPPLATLPVRPKSSATQPPNGSEPEPPSGGAATTAAPSAADESAEVVIEERRKRVLSDGSTDGSSYTIHRYVRGRLLGKGGFAKVYLCTAVDTNKHYAVKVVPKANLVKARARQKVRMVPSEVTATGRTTVPCSSNLPPTLDFIRSCKRRLRFTAC